LALSGTIAMAAPATAAPGSAVPVTTATSNEQVPKWSPDGSKLAFWSDRDGTGPFGLYVAAPDGTGTMRVVDAATFAVLAQGAPSVQQVDCSTGAPIGGATPAAGTLAYPSASGRYTFSWPTAAAWAGTCRQLVVTLIDGTSHPAGFRFT